MYAQPVSSLCQTSVQSVPNCGKVVTLGREASVKGGVKKVHAGFFTGQGSLSQGGGDKVELVQALKLKLSKGLHITPYRANISHSISIDPVCLDAQKNWNFF